MKRTLSLILTILLCLCGCSTADTTAEKQQLTTLLEQVDHTMQPGTAGSSLTAAYLAAALLDWSRDTTLDRDTVVSVTEAAMENAHTDHPAGFDKKLQSVHNAYELLMTPEAEGLLHDCGYVGNGYPWSTEDTAALEWVFETVLR